MSEGPDQHIEAAREVQQWRSVGQRDVRRSRHGVDFDLGTGIRQGPLHMMNLAAIYLPLVDRVETIALSQPTLDRSRLPQLYGGARSIAAADLGAGTATA